MKWIGERFKGQLAEAHVSQSGLARELGVSRQAVVSWTKGQVPRGLHLLAICRLLDVDPGVFFEEGPSPVQVAPRHRKRRSAKITEQTHRAAHELAMEYACVLEAEDMPVLEPVVRRADAAVAVRLAGSMRELAGLDGSREPLDYHHAFRLMHALGLCVVLRPFPDGLKDYAFYTVINVQRVVFVNSQTNLLDLIFPMLHEAVHAVRDPDDAERHTPSDEDDFCDRVAGLVQFPDGYVDDVSAAIKGRTASVKINTLKDFAARNHHVIYGIIKRIEEKHGRLSLPPKSIHGADGNLRKQFPDTLEDALLSDGPERFVGTLRRLSPIWFTVVMRNAEFMTTRKLADVLGLESVLDAIQVREEFGRVREGELNACPV